MENMNQNTLQEGSKLGIKLLETGETFGKFLGKLIGLTDNGFLGIIEDKLQFFRWERQCRIANKYNEIYGNQPMQPIPPKFLIPILENGSLEEDDNLQDLWINLLGAFTNQEYKEEKRMAYLDIIKSLNPLDVYILKEIYLFSCLNKRDDMKFIDIHKDKVFNDVDDNDFYLSLNNLYRVYCVKDSSTWEGKEGKSFSLTELGEKFVETCIENKISKG